MHEYSYTALKGAHECSYTAGPALPEDAVQLAADHVQQAARGRGVRVPAGDVPGVLSPEATRAGKPRMAYPTIKLRSIYTFAL